MSSKVRAEIEKRLRWQWRRPQSTSWRVDEIYVRVRGRRTYLYRALDEEETQSTSISFRHGLPKMAKRFLGKAPNG